MGAPGAGTRTVVERVKEALNDAPNYNFPGIVGTKSGAASDVEVVAGEEFQRRKVSGELPICWRGGDDGEYGYRSCLSSLEQGKNVVIAIPQSSISAVEKQFFFHTVRIVYLTAPVEARGQRRAQKGCAEPQGVPEKPLGPSVTTVVNSGTISEGAADVIAALKSHAREVVQFPPASITLPVVRSAQKESRDYLTEEVLPGLQTAVKALASLPEKPGNPYLWLADYLARNDPSAMVVDTDPSAAAVLQALDVIKAEAVNHVLDTPEDIAGVANFRRSKKCPRVYGVHQASTVGIRAVVEQLCGEHGTVVWVCLRDTPVVYVNGSPYTIHSKDLPDEDSLGVKKACVNNGTELEKVERQLVKDLVVRANSMGGQLQLFPAASDKNDQDVEPDPVAVQHDAVCTFTQVFDALEAEGFGVKLHRCLVCKDGAPELEEMDQIVAAIRSAGDKAAIVFQCSSGVERTQVGMTLANLMFAIDSGAKPRGYVDPEEGPAVPDLKDKAQYSGIITLCQHLPEGPLCKALADDVIDDNESAIHGFNLRKLIAQAASCGLEEDTQARSQAVCLAMDHLERYWLVISFAAYLRQQVKDKFQQSFSTWSRNKRGIRRSLHKLALV